MSQQITNTNENIENILLGVAEQNNEVRVQAEKALTDLEANRDNYILSLLSMVRISSHSSVRLVASVLLRQKLTQNEDPFWYLITDETKYQLTGNLLQILNNEKVLIIKEKICDIISEIASMIFEAGDWPELMPSLHSLCQSPEPYNRICGLRIFKNLSPYIAEYRREELPRLRTLYQLLLQQKDSPAVQVQACEATTTLLTNLNPVDLGDFLCMLPIILRALSMLFNDHQSEHAQSILQALINTVQHVPTFFTQNLESVISAMISIAGNSLQSQETRKLSLVLLYMLVDTAPTVIRHAQTSYFLQPVLNVIFPMLLEIEEDPDWETQDDEPHDENSLFFFALDVLDRIAKQIRGKRFLPFFYSYIEQFLSNENWKYRYAAMFAISEIAEIVPEDITQRASICSYVICLLDDPHPRVRYAAIYCIGRLSTLFSPYLQNELTHDTLVKLFSLMDKQQPARVRYITAAALSNFIDGSDADVFVPLLPDIINGLVTNLADSPAIVQSQIISDISSIALCVGTSFIPYYVHIMPILKKLYIHPPFDRTLENMTQINAFKCMTLECITIVGMSVGSLFQQDAREIMDVMYNEGMGEIEGESEDMKGAMISAWNRMCTALKLDFLPYTDVIIPLLLKTANMDYTVDLEDIDPITTDIAEDVLDDDDDDEDDDIIIQELEDGQVINIRTHVVEEKSLACSTLSTFLAELHEHIYKYFDSILNTLVPLLNSITFDDLRLCALSVMESALITVENNIYKNVCTSDQYIQLFNRLLTELLNCLSGEEELEILMPTAQTLKIILERSVLKDSQTNAVLHVLTESDFERIISSIKIALYNSMQRRDHLSNGEEDVEEEEEEEHLQSENNENAFQVYLSECIGVLLKLYQTKFFTVFDRLFMDEVLKFTDELKSIGDKQFGLFIIDDIIEYCGASAYPYYPQFLTIFLREIQYPDPNVRQSIAYGIGITAKYGGEVFESMADTYICALRDMLSSPESESPEYLLAVDNAISSLGKICYYHPNLSSYKMLFNFWLNCLPLHGDLEESDFCMNYLCELLEKNDINSYLSSISQILKVLCFSLELVKQETLHRIIRLISVIQTKVPSEIMNDLWAFVGNEKANLIRMAMMAQ